MNKRTRLEINIRRLLSKCETLTKENVNVDWRIEKYIETLQEMIEKLQTAPEKPNRDVLVEYVRRIEFLNGIVNTSKLSNPVERIVAAQLLPVNINRPNELTDGPSITTQIHQKTTAKYGQEIRDELFKSKNETSSNGLRHRNLQSSESNQNEEAIIKMNRDIQEKILENMLIMSGNLKDCALASNSIITKDISTLNKSDNITESNASKLKNESLKLEEHTKSNWRCWLWIMIAFVLIVFFNMVLFMKISRKRIV